MRPGSCPILAAWVLGGAGLAAFAPGCAHAQAQRPDLTGVWSGFLTTDTHPYWNIEDVSCFAGCSKVLYERIVSSFDDPALQGRPEAQQAAITLFFEDYIADVMTPEGLRRYQASADAAADLETYCEPYGVLRQALNPLPVRIRDEGDRLIFEYEEWSLTRTIHLGDGGEPPRSPSALGHSIGRYEDGALVVMTTGLTGDYYQLRQGSYSDAATIEERYVIHEDPRRLVLDLTVTDPVTLVAPYVWTKTWLYTPDVELIEDSCEDVPGQL